jgi:hypothetical protein
MSLKVFTLTIVCVYGGLFVILFLAAMLEPVFKHYRSPEYRQRKAAARRLHLRRKQMRESNRVYPLWYIYERLLWLFAGK